MDSRIFLQPAYVLHGRPYRDTSLLLEMFTPEHGRIGLVARGARGAKSKSRGLLQPFRALLVSWSGRGELQTLTAVEEASRPLLLRGENLVTGFYINELIMRLLERHDPHAHLFNVYAETLSRLAEQPEVEWCLRVFEKRLLSELGYGLLLDREADTGKLLEADRIYRYQIERGPLSDRDAVGVSIYGRSLLSLHREELADAESRTEAKRLMRAVLGWYLGDRPLKSRDLISGKH